MKIKVESSEDSLSIINNKVQAVVDKQMYIFEISEIEKVMIITTDLGPVYDDMCLAVKINNETAIFIMSEHPCYNPFLFEQLGKVITLNYDEIIKASACTENNIFIIYER